VRPSFYWEEPIEIEVNRTSEHLVKLYKPNRKPAALASGDVVRFKLALTPDGDAVLDIDSVGALDGGSICTIVSLGTDDTAPAQIKVRFAQADTLRIVTPTADGGLGLKAGEYFGEVGVVDHADDDAFKRAGYGPVLLKPAPGGDVGLT